MYRCATLSLTVRQVDRLRVFDKRKPGKVYGPEKDEVAGE
jgi:hypothetical protein